MSHKDVVCFIQAFKDVAMLGFYLYGFKVFTPTGSLCDLTFDVELLRLAALL